eukprot:CAMPEP_0184744922 /NCGR_PEP_ID=MMETSP0315-20130426/7667_1 /TAXON_ID=101924 /ORGANISM="Rhodosorus marinus, Strain UTEX LB 2760" /LENGTH=448 /DNA_ID=CAMNT_0027216899 /DNA_START=186 /DNA_END=1532 /DNA_ORIENTATION=+
MRYWNIWALGLLVLSAAAIPLEEESAPLKLGLVKKNVKRVLSRRLVEHEPKWRHVRRTERLGLDGTVRTDATMVAIHGGITAVGMYYSYVIVGGQKVDLQIDTGSAMMALPHESCSACRKGDNRYNPSKSSTSSEVQCHDKRCSSSSSYGGCTGNLCKFNLAYADSAYANGHLMCDSVDWGQAEGIDACFGAITKESADFERDQVDGILGLAGESLSCNPSCITPLFDAALEQKKISKNMFTVCMDDHGGSLSLGAADESVFEDKDKIAYIPMDESSFYEIKLDGEKDGGQIKVGDVAISTTVQKVVVDTGTTLLSVPKSVFDKMKEIFLTNYCNVKGLCGDDSWFDSGLCETFDPSEEDDILDNQLPVITLRLKGGFIIELTPRDYLLSYEFGNEHYMCLGIMYMAGTSHEFLLGNTVNLKYSMIYDRENHRLGIGKRAATCTHVKE